MNNKARRIFIVLLIIYSVLFLSGCWDQVEIKERVIVMGLGIDKIPGDNPILVTVQVASFSKNVGGSSSTSSDSKNLVVVQTSKGKSFYDAIYNFVKSSSRRVTFSHNRVIIFGKALAQSGVAGICDDMSRDYQFRRTNWLLVSESTAKEALESKMDLGTIPAKELEQMMIDLTKNAFLLPVNLNNFLNGLTSEGKSSQVPVVEVEPSGVNSSKRLRISKTAIFRKGRLVDCLTEEESKDLLWLTNGKKGGSFVVPFPSSGKAQQTISVEISDGTTRIRPRVTGDGIHMVIGCTGKGILRETESFNNNSKTMAQLESRVAELLRKRVEHAVSKAQQLKTDYLGFAGLIHGRYPALWHRVRRNWGEEEFPRIKSQVHFHIDISGFGIVRDSILKTNQ